MENQTRRKFLKTSTGLGLAMLAAPAILRLSGASAEELAPVTGDVSLQINPDH